LWKSEPEDGKTSLRQTPGFKDAVISSFTDGYSPQAIAKAIHKKAIDDGRYSGECLGKGLNYDKIYTSVNNFITRHKGGEKND
jgi:hypothetical protein